MKVLQLGSPILRERCALLSQADVRSSETQDLSERIIAVMQGLKQISPRNGNGLAAPQVGASQRLVVVYFDHAFHVMINPEYLEKSEARFPAQEGCLSCFYLRAPIPRHCHVRIRYLTRSGEIHIQEFSDNLAALVQHEIDHLDGILFLDHLEDTRQLMSIDALLEDNPERLAILKQMIEYITS